MTKVSQQTKIQTKSGSLIPLLFCNKDIVPLLTFPRYMLGPR